jgi:hypothetical protein
MRSVHPPPDARTVPRPARVLISADLRHPFVGTATLQDGVVTITGHHLGASGPCPGSSTFHTSKVERVQWTAP